jgi:hypothetical protein
MSLETAQGALRLRCRELVLSVGELVTIVHEDRPEASEVAVVDHHAENVSELQAAAVQAASASSLASVDAALASCRSTYWHRLAGFRPLAHLRRAAREHDREWRAWQRSVELSLARCEGALDAAEVALRGAWSELAARHVADASLPSTDSTPSIRRQP